MHKSSSSQFSRHVQPARPSASEQELDPRSLALPPGSRLAEFKILSVLEQGISGFTYLAMDHGLQRRVVIEEYLPATLAQRGNGPAVIQLTDEHTATFAQGLGSFIDQARLLAQFDHPSLMRVYRFWEANRTAYMATPCYEGTLLGAMRQSLERPPDEAWLRQLLLPLLEALDVLHAASCYHWEISPRNILLLPDGRPVLLNYDASHHGLVERHDPAFAPIERYAQSTTLQQGPWTHLYSLAAVAYYSITGELPPPSTVRALRDQMEPLFEVVDRLNRRFPDLNYSVALVSTIERALSIRPEERPQSVAEFKRALLGPYGGPESIVVQASAEETRSNGAGNTPAPARDESGWPSFIGEPRDEPDVRSLPAREAGMGFIRSHDQAQRAHLGNADRGLAAESMMFPDPDDCALSQERRDGRPDERACGPSRLDVRTEGGQRVWLAGFATLVLVVLAALGWMLWSDYRDAAAELRVQALAKAPPATMSAPAPPSEGPPSVLTPPQPVTPAPAPYPAASGSLSISPSSAPAEGTPDSVSSRGESVAQGPVGNAPSRNPPATTESAAPTLSLTRRVRNEAGNPRLLCGTRTRFSLYRCMKEVCESPRHYDHAECKHLRVMDEVKPYP